MSEAALLMPAALGFAAAVGLDPFLTLVLLAFAPFAGWTLPAGLAPIEEPSVLAVAVVLFLAEFFVERSRTLAAFWHYLQAVARPVAGALFAHLLVGGADGDPLLQVVAPLTAAAVALLVHLAKCGANVLLWFDGDRHVRPALISLFEDVCVAGLVVLSFDAPPVAGGVVLVFILALVTLGRGILRAGVFGHLLSWRRSWGSLNPFQWTTEAELPADLASKVAEIPRPLGRSFKAARVGGFRMSDSGLFRSGWLVVGADDPWWITRSWRGARMTALDMSEPSNERTESLFLQLGGGDASHAPSLILPRSGPSLEALNAELAESAFYAEPV